MELNKRSSKGASIIGLIILATMFIVLPIGLFGFELGRFTWATQQLRTAVDSAALAGVAQLAGADLATPATTQQNAINAAIIMFRQNQVMDDPLNNTPNPNTGSPRSTPTNGGLAGNPNNPGPHQSAMKIQLLDTNRNEVRLGNIDGRRIRVTGYYGYVPAFGKVVGIGYVPINCVSDGAVPMLDLVLCFDVSGSMDDETQVYFIRRRWDPVTVGANGTPGRIMYDTVAINKIFNVLQPPKTGTSVNVIPPQNLSLSSYIDTSPIATRSQGNATPKPFSEYNGQSPPPSPLASGLRAVNTSANPATQEAGRPPGNFSYIDPTYNKGENNSSVSSGNVSVDPNCATIFTDVVAVINGGGGFSYPNVGAIVEACRGNLDSSTERSNSKASTVPGMPNAIAGYRQDYLNKAAAVSTPINFSRTETNNFFDLMNTNTDAHFGLVAFSDTINQGSLNLPNVDSHYPLAGNSTFSIPLVALNNGSSNYNDVKAAVTALKPLGKTNIAAALDEAVAELSSGASRDEARKAIILFTDGLPNLPAGAVGGQTGYNSAAATAARASATQAANRGIPIYCIGLSNNASLTSDMNVFLKETGPAGGTPPGLAYLTQGKYWNVSTASGLQNAFKQIARELVQLVNLY